MWIEIASLRLNLTGTMVTPYGGVWIEMHKYVFILWVDAVTPYGGVWIEIFGLAMSPSPFLSLIHI